MRIILSVIYSDEQHFADVVFRLILQSGQYRDLGETVAKCLYILI